MDLRNTSPLLWKVFLPSSPKIAIETLTVLDGSWHTPKHEPNHLFINGYQSWSYCSSVAIGKCQPKSSMHTYLSGAFNLGAEYPPNFKKNKKSYHSDFFTSITSNGPALVLGWLSQRQQFGLIHYDNKAIQMHCSFDGILSFYDTSTDWSYCQFNNTTQPLTKYIDAVASYNKVKCSDKTKVGW